MARLRTIDEAAAYFLAQDAGTSLTRTALRRLVVTGQVPSVRVGTKYLLNLDALEAWLDNPTAAAPAMRTGIRRVDL